MLTIYTNGTIFIDGADTGLGVSQTRDGTQVYTRAAILGGAHSNFVHTMPHARYSIAHDKPASGAAGRAQFEADIRSLALSRAGLCGVGCINLR